MLEIFAIVIFIVVLVATTMWIVERTKHFTELNIKMNEKEIDHSSEFFRYFLSKVPDGMDAGIHFIDRCIEVAADNYTIMMLSQNTIQYLNDEDIEVEA